MSTRGQAGTSVCGSARLSGSMVRQSMAVGSSRLASYAIAGAGTDGPGLVLGWVGGCPGGLGRDIMTC